MQGASVHGSCSPGPGQLNTVINQTTFQQMCVFSVRGIHICGVYFIFYTVNRLLKRDTFSKYRNWNATEQMSF